jgi:hypothetical protein
MPDFRLTAALQGWFGIGLVGLGLQKRILRRYGPFHASTAVESEWN